MIDWWQRRRGAEIRGKRCKRRSLEARHIEKREEGGRKEREEVEGRRGILTVS